MFHVVTCLVVIRKATAPRHHVCHTKQSDARAPHSFIDDLLESVFDVNLKAHTANDDMNWVFGAYMTCECLPPEAQCCKWCTCKPPRSRRIADATTPVSLSHMVAHGMKQASWHMRQLLLPPPPLLLLQRLHTQPKQHSGARHVCFYRKATKFWFFFFRVSRTGKANRTYGIVFASYTHLFTGVPKV